jgi:Domain of unknown function (DUF4868)
MRLGFDFTSLVSTEFGIGREIEGDRIFVVVPVDQEIQDALREMAADTWASFDSFPEEPRRYEPAEKYESQERLFIPTEDSLAAELRNLHSASNLESDSGVLTSPDEMFCYFARFTDAKGRRLTAVRRSTQFKGVLKSRLIQLLSDTLRLVQEKTFKLDKDFDMLIDSARVHILRPSGFEFAGRLQEAIREAVTGNIQAIQEDLPFVDFSNIEEYAAGHTRAARHLASIRGQLETRNISQALLKKACKTHGVDLHLKNGKIVISPGSEMSFLDVLDRRRYELELVEGSPERYKATSRQRVES